MTKFTVVCAPVAKMLSGDLSGVSALDAADQAGVAAGICKGRVALKVENEILGGDPAYGTPKALRLVYLLEGKRQEQTFAENTSVELGSAEQPVEIVKAEYGRLDDTGGGNTQKVEAAAAEKK